MEDKPFKVNYMCYYMLFEFHKSSNPITAVKNITTVYAEGVSVRDCCRDFSKFKAGNFDLSDKPQSGRLSHLENLKTAVKEDS